VKEFVADAPPSSSRTGSIAPLGIDVHTGKDKDRARNAAGRQSDDKKKAAYAIGAGESSVMLVPDDVWTGPAQDGGGGARQDGGGAFERDKITRVDRRGPRARSPIVREGDRWRLSQPEALPTDQLEAGAFVMNVRNLRAQAFLSDDCQRPRPVPCRPQVKVTLTSSEGGKTGHRRRFCWRRQRRRGEQRRPPTSALAWPAVAPSSWSTPRPSSTSASRPPNCAIASPRVVGGLEPKAVKRMHVSRDGKAVLPSARATRSGACWSRRSARPAPAWVDDGLFGVRGLKWKEIVAPKGEDAAKYGARQAGKRGFTLYRR